MLLDLGDGEYEVRCLTEKGRRCSTASCKPRSAWRACRAGAREALRSRRKCGLSSTTTSKPASGRHGRWRCLGCGACAYTCPTCHCFDIVDEGNVERGVRAPELGLLPVPHVHAARLRPQPARQSARAAAAAHRSQVPHLSGEVRRNPLHRLRQLHAQLPGGPGRAEAVLEAIDGESEQMACNEHLYKPDLMEVIAVRQQTPDVKSVRVRFRDAERARDVLVPRRPVRHLLRVRLRRIHLQHLFQLELEGPHRVLLPQGGPRHRSAVEASKRATPSASADPTATAIRWTTVEGQEPDLPRRRNRHAARSAAPSGMRLENRADYGDITIVYGARTVATWFTWTNWTNGPSTTACAWCAASIPAARRPTGKARSASCPPSSSAPECRPKTPSPWSSARRS